MQGRLVPPIDGRIQVFPGPDWVREFPNAAAAGLTHIEWIYDDDSAVTNPLCSEAGLRQIRHDIEKYKVQVISLCADYFMVHGFLRVSAEEYETNIAKFFWLIEAAQSIGVRRIVLPFVDQAAIHTAEEEAVVVKLCDRLAPALAKHGMELHLETALGPKEFRSLLDRIPHSNVKANYDTGNSSGIGYDPAEELAAYGARIGSVHIKDRKQGGTTFPLGQGSAQFKKFFKALVACGYRGDFILQVAREESGREVESARRNREFVETHLQEAGWIWS